jgi:tripartite-type tricarboxylate transporter receptor subunit TctC
MHSFARRALAALGIGFAAAAPAAFAQDPVYPATTVKFIVPFAAGGTTDILARVFAQKMSEAWGHPVVVENRAGAGGVIGSEVVARAAPDGYTLVLGTIGTHGVSTSLIKNLSFHPERDFSPVTLLATLPNIVAIHPSVPAKDLKELVAYAKANPGKLSYASAGAGTASHIAGEYFKRVAGVDVVHVPYKGSAPALTDVMAGHVAYTFDYLPSTLPHVRSGKLRGIAVTGPRRSRAAPELPTAMEAGLADFNVVTWYAVYAPANTPKAIVDKIRDTLARAAQAPEVIKKMDDVGVDLVVSTPAELATFQRAEIERWSKLIKEANITAQ